MHESVASTVECAVGWGGDGGVQIYNTLDIFFPGPQWDIKGSIGYMVENAHKKSPAVGFIDC